MQCHHDLILLGKYSWRIENFLDAALLPDAVTVFLQIIALYKLYGGLCDGVNTILIY